MAEVIKNKLIEIRFQFPADPYFLKTVRSIIQSTGQKIGLNLDEIRNMQIVSGELISNIILHTYKNDKTQIIIFKIIETEKKVSCFFRDFGPRADLSTFKSRDLSDYREKGLGLFLAHKLSNYLHYDRTMNVGTEVVASFNKL